MIVGNEKGVQLNLRPAPCLDVETLSIELHKSLLATVPSRGIPKLSFTHDLAIENGIQSQCAWRLLERANEQRSVIRRIASLIETVRKRIAHEVCYKRLSVIEAPFPGFTIVASQYWTVAIVWWLCYRCSCLHCFGRIGPADFGTSRDATATDQCRHC